MRIYIFYLLSLFMFFSCLKRENDKVFNYFSNKDLKIDSLPNKVIKYRTIVSSDSVKLFDNAALITKFKYSFTNNGLYVVKDAESYLLYSFTDSTDIIRPDWLIPPFYKSVKLVGKKDYWLNKKVITIFHFVENGYDETLDSYYMEGKGFICFYKYSEDNYIYLNDPDAIMLSSQFLTDSTFFAMLKMREIDKRMGR